MADQARIISFYRTKALAHAVSAGALAHAVSAGALAHAVSAVVPAFNEEAGITSVLELLHRCPELVRITVVDDGSTDGTARRVLEYARREPRLRLLRLKPNRGKGSAMAAGAEASPSDLVLFLDADLIGVSPQQLRKLIEPVRRGSCSMSLAVFSGPGGPSDRSQAVLPGLSGQRNSARWSGQRNSARWSGQRNSARLSGQRCLRWSQFRETPGLAETRYGAEVALNRFARKQGLPVQLVQWPGVTHLSKYEKRGWLPGLFAYLRMYLEILLFPLRVVQAEQA